MGVKIAWLLPNLHVTGGARVAVELSNRLINRGHKVSLLIPAGRNRLLITCRADVIECGARATNPFWAVPLAMAGAIHALPSVDVVLGSMPPYVLLARFLARRRRIPAVNYLMNDDVHFFDDRTHIRNRWVLSLYRFMARRSIRRGPIFVNSHWTAVRCVTEGGSRPFAFIPHGYDPTYFHPEAAPHEDGVIQLVVVGRRERWKGFDDLVMALNSIAWNEHPFHLTVISQDALDLSSARFPYTIAKPQNERDLAAQFQAGQIFIHTSWFEGFGMPPLEAMACGLAVVATESGGVREYLHDGENALIVSPREPRSLVRAIQKLMEDSDLRRSLAKQGLADSLDFTWDKAADKFEKVLLEITSDANAHRR